MNAHLSRVVVDDARSRALLCLETKQIGLSAIYQGLHTFSTPFLGIEYDRRGLLYLDKHFPQHLVQGEWLKSIRDEPLQEDGTVGDPGREVGLGEERQREGEIDVADH